MSPAGRVRLWREAVAAAVMAGAVVTVVAVMEAEAVISVVAVVTLAAVAAISVADTWAGGCTWAAVVLVAPVWEAWVVPAWEWVPWEGLVASVAPAWVAWLARGWAEPVASAERGWEPVPRVALEWGECRLLNRCGAAEWGPPVGCAAATWRAGRSWGGIAWRL